MLTAGISNGFTVEGCTVEPSVSALLAVIPTIGTLPLIALALLMLGFAFRRRNV